MTVLPIAIEAQLEKFPKHITKRMLFGPSGEETGVYGLFDEHNRFVGRGSVTDRYVPHQLEHVRPIIESVLGLPGFEEPDVRAEWKSGHYIRIRPNDSYRREIIKGDTIWPQLDLWFGLGGLPARGRLALQRDACSNLMMVRNSSEINFSIKHTKSLETRIATIQDQFHSIVAKWDEVVDHCRNMHAKRINLKHLLAEIYPAPKSDAKQSTTKHNDKINAIWSRVMRESHKLNLETPSLANPITTGWMAFNAIQGYRQHTASRNGEKGMTKDQKEFNRSVSVLEDSTVQRAEELILSM